MSDDMSTIQELEARLASCEQESRRAERVHAALYEIAAASSTSQNMNEFYATLHRIVSELMYAKNFFVAVHEPHTGILSWPYFVDEADAAPPSPQQLQGFRGATSHVIRTGRTNHQQRDAEYLLETGELEIVGTLPVDAIFVPLQMGEKTLGALAVQSYTDGMVYTEPDVQVLEFVAQHIATALTRARAIDETRQRNSELAIINSVGEAMARTLDIKTMARIVGDKVRGIFEADGVSIMLLDPQTNLIHVQYEFDKGEGGYVDYIEPFPLGKGLTTQIINSRQPLLLGSREEQTLHGAYMAPEALDRGSGIIAESWLGVPIIVGEKVLGIVSITEYQAGAFNEGHQRLLQTLSTNMGVAIENARLFEAEQQRAAELAIINSVQEGLASKLDYESIISLVGEKVGEIFKADTAYIGEFDAQTQLFRFPYYVDKGHLAQAGGTLPLGQGLTSVVFNTRRPLRLGTIEEQRRQGGTSAAYASESEDQNESYLGVPILTGGEVTGVVSVQRYERNAFSENDARLLTTLANSMSVALENARLFDEVQKRNLEISEALEQQTATSDILRVMAASPNDVQPVLEVIVEHAIRLCEGINSSVYLTDGKLVYEAVSRDTSPEALELNRTEYPRPLTQDSSLSSRAILGKAVLNIADSQNDPNLPELTRQYSRVLGMKSILFVPLLKDGDARGALAVSHGETGLFSEKQVALLKTFADQAVIAIENVRLFNETRRLLKETEQRAAELAIINSVQEGLASKLDMQAIYDLVGEKIRDVFGSQVVNIVTHDRATDVLTERYSFEKGDRTLLPKPTPSYGFRKHVIDTRQPLVLNRDIERAGIQFDNPVLTGAMPKSAVFVPMIAGDTVTGIISLQNLDHEDAFSDADLRLLQTLASSMSVALENARLFDEVQTRNHEISETLEQQTATSEILSVIAGSPTEIKPVLDAVAQHAARLCGADDVQIYQVDGRLLRQVTHHGPLPALQDGEALPLVPGLVTGRAVLERRTIHIEDMRTLSKAEYPDSVKLQERLGHRTAISTPLLREGKAIGAIVVRRNAVRPFTNKQVALLSTFADQAAIAIENVRLFNETTRLLKETEQRAAELAIINSVQEGLASKLDMQAIYDLVGDKIHDIFRNKDLGIRIHDPRTDLLHFPYTYERGKRITIPSEPLGHAGFTAHVLRTREPLVVNENMAQKMQEYRSFPLPGTEVPKSAVLVPLVVGEEANGLINLSDYNGEHAFTDSDVRLLTTVANSMSVALENARLFDETQRLLKETEQRAAELAIINSVQEGLASKLEMQAIYDLVGDKIHDIFHNKDLGIRIHDPRTDLLHFPYTYERGKRITIPSEPLGHTGFTAHVLRTREPLLVNENMAQKMQEYGSSLLDGTEMERSAVLVPLIVGGQARGIISLMDLEREGAFSDSDVRLLQTLANSMSVALENARLFDETQRLLKETDQRAAELAIINSVQEGLASKLDMQAIYDLVGDKIKDIFDSHAVTIAVYDRANNRLEFPYYLHRDSRLAQEAIKFGEGLTSHVIRTRQPLLINQDAEKRYAELGAVFVAGDDHAKSWLGVPIAGGSEASGAIFLQNYEREDAYSEADVRLLSTMATSMGVALENARLFNETQRLLKETERRAAELSAISTVSQALVAETDLDKMIQLIGDQMRSTFGADIVYVALLDRQANMITFPYMFGQELSPLPVGEGLSSKIIETGQPILINTDIEKQVAELGARRVGREALSYLGVPILAGGQAIGVISVQSTTQENAFGQDELGLLSTIAANAGAAIRTAQLHAETEHRAQEMATLAEIGNDIAATRELEPVLQRIATHAKDIMRVRDIAISLREAGGEIFRTAVSLGRYQAEMKALVVQPGTGILGHILQSGVAEYVNNPHSDARKITVPGTPEDADAQECLMGAPLISRGDIIGGIMVWRERLDGLFTQAELDFLVSVARQTAIAIESARLYLETQRRANEMSALADVGREISASLDPAVVLEKVAVRAKELLAADTSAVYLMEPDQKSMRAITALGTLAESIKADVIRLGDGVIGTLAQHGTAEFVNDTSKDPRSVTIPGTDDIAVERLMATPLMRAEKVVGMMAVWRSTDPFNESDLNFLTGLARQAAIALENARLFAQVKAEKQYSDAVVQNSPVAIVTVDEASHVVAWNPGAEKLFGYARDEAIGRNVDALVAVTQDLQTEAEAYNRQIAAKDLHVITKRTRKDRSLVDVELSGVPLPLPSGKTGLVAIYHDITELQRARQEAVAANEAKSAFLATMSHEIRTPMNAVIGMSGLLMDTQLSKEQLDYAETIRNSGDALLAIINDILDFSKIEAGKMELELQPLDLRECVESALDLVAGRAVEKNLDLAYIIEDDVPLGISGDVTRLRQILLNLMSNAVKFTEKGEVVLTVKRDKRPDHLLISVWDTGIGILADRMNRLFASFSQADSSTTRRFGGTGLGLAISKRLAEMMGGAMWAESAGAGTGSTFWFTLKAEAAALAERRTTRDLKGVQPSLEGKRVLIVDDNGTNRRILILQTAKWGMLPRETHSPREALRWLKAGQTFDLAILDVQMPEMDGITLTRELHQLKVAESLPVILLTSLGRKEAGSEDVLIAAYLTKPLKPSALFDALASIFARNVVMAKSETVKATIDADMARRHPLRILLAEDNAVNQKLALRLLDQMGYRADVASNGLEAVDSVQRQSYDLVLMDVQMPEMDGLDATRAIRNIKALTQPRIVAMTANAMQGDREMCIAAGMDDYVSKPIRVQELVEALLRSTGLEPVVHADPSSESAPGKRRAGRRTGKAAPKTAGRRGAKSQTKAGRQ